MSVKIITLHNIVNSSVVTVVEWDYIAQGTKAHLSI